MNIEIPDDLYETFTNFLDLSQASFTEEDIAQMSEVEQRMFIFLESLLGEDRVHRFSTRKDLNNAKAAFFKATGKECR